MHIHFCYHEPYEDEDTAGAQLALGNVNECNKSMALEYFRWCVNRKINNSRGRDIVPYLLLFPLTSFAWMKETMIQFVKRKKKKTCTCVTPSRWHFFLVCSPNTLTQVNHVSGGDETKTKARRHYQKGKGLYSLKYNIVFKIFWGWINPSILQVLMYHRPYSNGPELRFQGQAWDSNFKPRLTIPHIVSGLPLPASEKIKLLFWWLVWFVSCFSTVIILSG